MKRKSVSVIMLTLLVIGMLTFAFNIQPVKAEPTTIVVPDDYPTMQEAINAAGPGDIIYVLAGTYYENVAVNKTVLLIGEARETTIIDGSGSGTVVDVTANGVLISNFTIRKSGSDWPDNGIRIEASYCNITSNLLTNNRFGIFLKHSSNNNAWSNNVTNNEYGVYLYHSANHTISANNITNNEYGVYLYHSANHTISANNITNKGSGVYLYHSSNNTISANNITSNYYGVVLHYSSNNTISANNIANNYEGVVLEISSNYNTISVNNITANYSNGVVVHYSSNNTISANNIRKNGYGIVLRESSSNKIFHNSFKCNTQQVYDRSWDNPEVPPSINVWDNGYPSGGNYWNDYAGVDENSGPNQDQPGSDGIGDSRYFIDANNQDNYPLIYPYSRVPWDITGPAKWVPDSKVDIRDIALAASLFGSVEGDGRYDKRADITGPAYLVPDGKIDIRDIALIAKHFGETCV